ncbi:MAG: baseplate J/gp47 family protein [Candidatus Zixiibacteriota bacterium]|nr:MAG: baseplate J/gp47 family protein [candidate division Zixibacteria bacterium]
MPSIPLYDSDLRDERARDLEDANLNGIRMVLVQLLPSGAPSYAQLEVFFFNDRHRDTIRDHITADPGAVCNITGGIRILAGSAEGQVKVTGAADGSTDESLYLTVEPIGDYSTYTLSMTHQGIDRFFDWIKFRFRPGCFTTDCNPPARPLPPVPEAPPIDYLAKDYESFRHTLISAMTQRVPNWLPTSEADLDQVLIDLLAAVGDEMSDFQDRVMSEAFFTTCRRRVSLARHARMMDYHVHQGNQASTWLSLKVNSALRLVSGLAFDGNFDLEPVLQVWTGSEKPQADSVFFTVRDEADLDVRLNRLLLYTWGGAVASLKAGSTSADLLPGGSAPSDTDVQDIADLINGVDSSKILVRHLLVEECLNPATGEEAGRDRNKRQLLKLTGAEVVKDTLTGQSMVRVHWRDEDRLKRNYVFTTFCPEGPISDVSKFRGNLVRAYEGRIANMTFYSPGETLPPDTDERSYRYFEPTERYGTLCGLPHAPVAYESTEPGEESPPKSTLHVEVEEPGAGRDIWDEVISLVHSDDSSENGDHFAVETDELRQSILRFGNGVNGRSPAAGSRIHCAYQVGGGVSGNVGFDSLVFFDGPSEICQIHNPFDVTDGRDPEPVDQVLRYAPEAYRARQLRAITLGDYVDRANEVSGVSRAAARYVWTGSWRAVRIVIDPAGTTVLGSELRHRVFEHLEAVRLIGEDLEIRAPRYVPLRISVRLCVRPDAWPQDVRSVLIEELSSDYTSDGRMGLFHPDNWTFAQPLHRSEIEGRIHQIPEVDHIESIVMQRFARPTPGMSDTEVMEVGADEIIMVENNPSHQERGIIELTVMGGRG